MATENIRRYTVSDAIVVQPPADKKIKEKVVSKWNIFTKNSAPSTAVNRAIKNNNEMAANGGKRSKSEKNEIFVDIFEKLSVSIFLFCY
jgi:hypothetical protein